MKEIKPGKIIIPAGVHPWPHELRVVEVLANAGHKVEFIPTGSISSADIYLDDIEFEIKSLESDRAITIERAIKKALKQSHNIIIDISHIKGCDSNKVRRFLISQIKLRRSIKRLLLITKQSEIIDILTLV